MSRISHFPTLFFTRAAGISPHCGKFAIDYRELNANANTRKEACHLPLIQDILDQMGGKTIFSNFDFQSGFHEGLNDKNSNKLTKSNEFIASMKMYSLKIHNYFWTIYNNSKFYIYETLFIYNKRWYLIVLMISDRWYLMVFNQFFRSKFT